MYVVDARADHTHHPSTEVSSGTVEAYPEAPRRAEAIRAALAACGWATVVPARPYGLAPVLAVHDPGLVQFLERAWTDWAGQHPGSPQAIPDTFPTAAVRHGMGQRPRPPDRIAGALGHWCFDTATPVVAGTWAAARAAVDVALTAADLVASGEPAAYGLCRPPGHHAARAAFGGYCYLNNAAVAAHWLSGHTGDRISVLDIDFHHGNGTQQIFYHRPDVQYVSLHGDPDRAFPYVAGYADETGAGAGLGTTLNIPLPAGVDDDGYLAALERALAAVDSFDPAIVVVSLGADTAAADPLGDLMLTLDGLRRAGAAIAGLHVPTLVLQEGGYAIADLGGYVSAFLLALERGGEGPATADG